MIKNALESILGTKERRLKKYAIDSLGNLRLRTCPEVQVALINVLREHGDLDAMLEAREKEEKDDKKCK